MLKAEYLREQARTCRKLAETLSNTDTADMFRNMGRDYDARAEEAEAIEHRPAMPLR